MQKKTPVEYAKQQYDLAASHQSPMAPGLPRLWFSYTSGDAMRTAITTQRPFVPKPPAQKNSSNRVQRAHTIPAPVLPAIEQKKNRTVTQATERLQTDEKTTEHPIVEFISRALALKPADREKMGFVYALVPTNFANPYALQIVSYEQLRELNPESYLIFSGNGVTQVTNSKPTEMGTLQSWMLEYSRFQTLRQIPFIKKFSKWKHFFYWKQLVTLTNRATASRRLEEHFLLDPELRPNLLRVHAICRDLFTLTLHYPADLRASHERNVLLQSLETGFLHPTDPVRRQGSRVHPILQTGGLALFTLAEFEACQSDHGRNVQRQIESRMHALLDIVAAACESSLAVSQLDAPLLLEDEVLPMPTEEEAPSTARSARNRAKQQPKTKKQQEDPHVYSPAYMVLSAKRKHCNRLTRFVRLVDFVVVDCLVDMVIKSVAAIVSELNPDYLESERQLQEQAGRERTQAATVAKQQQRAAGIRAQSTIDYSHLEIADTHFKDDLPFALYYLSMEWNSPNISDDLHIVPSETEFLDALEIVVTNLIHLASGVRRLLPMEALERFTAYDREDWQSDRPFGKGPDVTQMIRTHPRLEPLCAEIIAHFENSYTRVSEYARSLEPFKRMYLENRKMDMDHVRASSPSVEWFAQEISRYKKQHEQILRIPDTVRIGIFVVSNTTIKETFWPAALQCAENLRNYLPLLAKQRNAQLNLEVTQAVSKLEKIPITAEDYAETLSFALKIFERMEGIENDFTYIADLYVLCDEEGVKPPQEDLLFWNSSTQPMLTRLRHAVALAEECKEERIIRFAALVDGIFAELVAGVKQAVEQAAAPQVDDWDADVDTMVQYTSEIVGGLDDIQRKLDFYNVYQVMFDLPKLELHELWHERERIGAIHQLWVAMGEWTGLSKGWLSAPVRSIDAESVDHQVTTFTKLTTKLAKILSGSVVLSSLKVKIEDITAALPLIQALRNPELRPVHWEELDRLIGKPVSIIETGLTLGDLLELRTLEKLEAIQRISRTASEEARLKEAFDKVLVLWNSVEFTFHVSSKNGKETVTVTNIDEVLQQADDSIISLHTIQASKFGSHLSKAVGQHLEHVTLMRDTLLQWGALQRKWLYLESVVVASDLARQLPNEAKQFGEVDKYYRELTKRTQQLPNVYRAATAGGLKDRLNTSVEVLERVGRKLEDNLETKRATFPRLYFVSNDDLLETLAHSKNPKLMVHHLPKMFANIHSLEFGPNKEVTGMVSEEGEKVPLTKALKTRGSPEVWLVDLEKQMTTTIRRLLKRALQDYDSRERLHWIKEYPCQVVLCVTHIYWTSDVTECLRSPTPHLQLQKYKATGDAELEKLTDATRTEGLTVLQRNVLSSLVVVDVHCRDVLEELLAETTSDSFTWQKVLRYYWEENECVIRQGNNSLRYGYEYLGGSTRLVVTPLTERVDMTLINALHLRLGGMPAGPAGTGKTESIKDLAKALARHVYVYNCSEGITASMTNKLFTGLVQSGAWCCLDEFNRIGIEVLSVIGSQMMTIREAMLAHRTTVILDGRESPLVASCGIFATINPGYPGRTELPNNVWSMFRPIALTLPDYRQIVEVMLLSAGFQQAHTFSRKIVQFFRVASQQVRPQDHYDWGLRAIKVVLRTAADRRVENPGADESQLIVGSIREAVFPKLLACDIPLLEDITRDLFPELGQLAASPAEELHSQILSCINVRKLAPQPEFVRRVENLQDLLQSRHGVLIVGPPGSGKTTCRQVLANTLSTLRIAKRGVGLGVADQARVQDVVADSINPKSVTYAQLFGTFDPATGEWRDGVLPAALRRRLKEGGASHKWVVLDGPVEPQWIESLNSVLDDSKTLCLDSGERMRIAPQMRFIFETDGLTASSPATVSRLAVLYVPAETVSWRSVVHEWSATSISRLHPSTIAHLVGHVTAFLPRALTFRATQCEAGELRQGESTIARTLCDTITALCHTVRMPIFGVPLEECKQLVNDIFVFAYIWSIGGALTTTKDLQLFDDFAREQLDSITSLPGFGVVFDYCLDFERGKFSLWSSMVPQFTLPRDVPLWAATVPTVDTVRYSVLLQLQMTINKPVLLAGDSGVGKTTIIRALLAGQAVELPGQAPHTPPLALSPSASPHSADSDVASIRLSAKTSAGRIQDFLEAKLEGKRKDGMAQGRPMLLFVDDINMPSVDRSSLAQPPLEFLRQLIGENGLYDRSNWNWRAVSNVEVIAACALGSGGRQPVPERLLRYFHVYVMPMISEESLGKIFATLMDGLVGPIDTPDIRALAKPAVTASVELFHRVAMALLPTPDRSHYKFNLRDLIAVGEGMLQVRPQSVTSSSVFVRLWIHEVTRSFHDRLVTQTDRDTFFGILIQILARHFGVTWKPNESQPLLFGDFSKFGLAPVDRSYEEISDISRLQPVLEDYLDEYNVASSKQLQIVFFKDAVEHICRIIRVLRRPKAHALLLGVPGVGKESLTRLAAAICEYQLFSIEVTKNYRVTDFYEDRKTIFHTAGVMGNPVVFLVTEMHLKNNDTDEEWLLEEVNLLLGTWDLPNLHTHEEREAIITALRDEGRKQGIESRNSVYDLFLNRVRQNLHVVLCMNAIGDNFHKRYTRFPALVNCCTLDWFGEWPSDALQSVAHRFLEDEAFRETEGAEESQAAIAQSSSRRRSSAAVPFTFPAPATSSTPPLVDPTIAQLAAKLQVHSEACVAMHDAAVQLTAKFQKQLRRYHYVTPAAFIDFLSLYCTFSAEKQAEFRHKSARFTSGLHKLISAEAEVEDMEKQVIELQPVLERKKIEVGELLVKLNEDTAKVNKVRDQVAREEAAVNAQTQDAEGIANEARRSLEEALPKLEAAVSALDSLNKSDLSEMKNYKAPPPLAVTVMEAVLVLRGEQKVNWEMAKVLLADANFLTKLKNFDKDHIPAATIAKLQPYLRNPEFDPDLVGRVSVAAKSLAMWVIAIENYHQVLRMVEPKRELFRERQQALEARQRELQVKREALQRVENQLAAIQRAYNESNQEKFGLEQKTKLCGIRLQRAATLTTALQEEKVRWAETVARLKGTQEQLGGNLLLAAACVAYLGPFTAPYRATLVEEWRGILQTHGITAAPDFTLESVLSNPVELREWRVQSLPGDLTSIHNAILVKNSRRWPLLIDPQGQAARWIRKMEAPHGLKVLKGNDPNFIKSLETCIRSGNPVLIEDVSENLDAALDPILLRQVHRQGNRWIIRIGEYDVDYDQNFQLYLCTNLANPHYLPDTASKVALINFTVTSEGLAEQLLHDVVAIELPELEERRTNLVANMTQDKNLLTQIEDNILLSLQQAQGNILDDEVLINHLGESKLKSEQLTRRLREAETTEEEIEAARGRYDPVAQRGSLLYFILADLATLNPLYQYSLYYFKTSIFSNVILSTQQAVRATDDSPAGGLQPAFSPEELEARLSLLVRTITEACYDNVARGLLERDRLTFSFLIAAQSARQESRLSDPEWNFFLRGPAAALRLAQSSGPVPPSPRTASVGGAPVRAFEESEEDAGQPNGFDTLRWNALKALEQICPNARGLRNDIARTPLSWGALVPQNQGTSGTAEITSFDQALEHLPYRWKDVLTPFQLLLLLRTLKDELTISSMVHFVETTLGKTFVGHPLLDMEQIYQAMSYDTPVLFILDAGSDPTPMLIRFASEMGFKHGLKVVSMGQGQSQRCKRLISNAMQSGTWVVVQNCHLSTAFLADLERIVLDDLVSVECNQSFRLFLTTSGANQRLPIPVLQRCIKLTTELPGGIRANMIRCINAIQHESFNTFSQQLRGLVHTQSAKILRTAGKERRPSASTNNSEGRARDRTNDDADATKVEPERSLSSRDSDEHSENEPAPPLSSGHPGSRGLSMALGEFEELAKDSEIPQPALEYPVDAAKAEHWRRLLFALCAFHCIVQERKRFGPLGWNVPYSFSDHDLEVSQQWLRMLLAANESVPWQAIHYILGEINYGGRVTDSHDRRLLMTLVRAFFSPMSIAALPKSPPQSTHRRATLSDVSTAIFPAPLPRRYWPTSDQIATLDDAKQFVDGLPSEDDPAAFGVHQNVVVRVLKERAESTIASILSVQPRWLQSAATGTAASKGPASAPTTAAASMADDTLLLNLCETVTTQIPQPIENTGTVVPLSPSQLRRRSTAVGILSTPLSLVLAEELQHYNSLVQMMRDRIEECRRSLQGACPTSLATEELTDALRRDRVPNSWAKLGRPVPPNTSLASWLMDLRRSRSFLEEWIKAGTPMAFWLPGFTNPQRFITAVLQAHARKHAAALDALTLTFRVLTVVDPALLKTAPSEGVYVYGLTLDGARWDSVKGCLADPRANEVYSALPVLHIIPTVIPPHVDNKEGDMVSLASASQYVCPVYRTSQRKGLLSSAVSSSFVINVDLPIPNTSTPADWVKKGVALLLNCGGNVVL
eukprot:TRINITY_DN5499_c0_g1_i1.p1 TRINITY_DN5499_c0_g1~~TRINITY_DN5499_c0_g1_i1.p1  ORF type:complete len:4402 (-),score=749.29 TRINITY_DN5499_c0_g1_i1:60-13265(-)